MEERGRARAQFRAEVRVNVGVKCARLDRRVQEGVLVAVHMRDPLVVLRIGQLLRVQRSEDGVVAAVHEHVRHHLGTAHV